MWQQGTTRIFPIQIPYFKQILLESFSCDHCGERNNSVKSAGAIQEKGVKYTFRLDNEDDFQRQVVRGDTGVFKVEDLDLVMPPSAGQLTNLESIFNKIKIDLEVDQPTRKDTDIDLYNALNRIIEHLSNMLRGESFPITVSLDDISGNSFIEPSTSDTGSKYMRHDYLRTHAQNVSLGLALEDEGSQANADPLAGVDIVDGEIYELPAECPACSKPCTVNMKKVNIPHFKDVIIMATVCENCGYRTSDVKTGGEIPEKGKRVTLQILNKEDLSRDILKSETCTLRSPELALEVHPGTLGGRFTTVEGLLTQIRDQLYGQIFDVDADTEGQIHGGDSMTEDRREKWNRFFEVLEKALKAEFSFHVTLDDPLANSHIQSLVDDDPQVVSEDYERSEAEEEELGLKDMKVEGYEEEVAG